MKRIIKLVTVSMCCILTIGMFSCDDNTINQIINGGLSEAEIIEGLKEALSVGADASVSTLSKSDGYFTDLAVKVLLPEDAQKVLDDAEKLPGYALVKPIVDNLKGDVILSLNRAAEDAAPEAKDIFISAITDMSISDGLSILNGNETAATDYLYGNTYDALVSAFAPKISTSLDKGLVAGQSANQLYGGFVTQYNKIANGVAGQIAGLDAIASTDLGEHVTGKGLDGLFLKVADEEKAIRNDPFAYANAILEKVFGN